MRDSLTYQAVLEEGRIEGRIEGRVEGARRVLRRLGERRFGTPNPTVVARLDGMNDLERIERATLRLLDATSWEDALAGSDDR